MSGGTERSFAERAADAVARTIEMHSEGLEALHPATLAKLEEAVRSLRRVDREVFLAHRLDAMGYEEIARRTGLSTHQVERAMARALRGIDRYLCDEPRHRYWWLF